MQLVRRDVFVTLSFLFLLSILFAVDIDEPLELVASGGSFKKLIFSKANIITPLRFSRKLLSSPDDEGNKMNRLGGTCSKGDIVLFQGPTAPLPSGIPTYTVQVQNVCVSGCKISNIHLSCGWFSSARLINPSLFRRIDYDDCLVNDGDTLSAGDALSFQYANSFPYPLSVSSVTC